MPANLENSAVATGLEKVSFHSSPKEGQCQRMFKLPQLCSFHMLVRICSKTLKLSFSSSWTENFQMYKLGFKETKESEIKLPTSAGLWRKQGSSRKTSASPTTWNLWLCGSQQTTENSSRDGNTRAPDLSPEKSVCIQEATFRTGYGTTYF